MLAGLRVVRPRTKCQQWGRPTARGTGAAAEDDQEVGAPYMSYDAGEQQASGPDRAKAGRADTNLKRET